MKSTLHFFFTAALVMSLPVIIKAEEKTSTAKVEQQATDLTDTFRYERFRSHDLKELKTKLISNCNLNKPFSSSLSSVTSEDFMYCCHTK